MYGDQALLVNFEQKIDAGINKQVIALKDALEREELAGILYTIPAYCSLTIAYDPNQTNYSKLSGEVERLIMSISEDSLTKPGRKLLIPVCYDKEFALDFGDLSEQTSLTREEIIEIHTKTEFRVYMLGFMPGFTYMGKLPEKLYCKRKKSPRLKVPTGSVGLAGFQTGIYPSELPGGWQIIGRTPLSLFDPNLADPFLFQAGDLVQFRKIGLDEYGEIKKQENIGMFNLEQIFR